MTKIRQKLHNISEYRYVKPVKQKLHNFSEYRYVKPVKWCAKKTYSVLSNKHVMKYGSVTTGILAGLLSLYGVFKDGSAKGSNRAKEEMAAGYIDLFAKSGKSSRYSHLLEKIKKPVTNYRFNEPIYPAYVKSKNQVKSILGEVVNNGINIAAAGGAVAAPLLIHNPAGLGIGAVCAGVLLLRGAGFVFHDVWGIGKKGL